MKIQKGTNGYMITFERDDWGVSHPITDALIAVLKKHKCKYIPSLKKWYMPKQEAVINDFMETYESLKRDFIESRMNLEEYTEEDFKKLMDSWGVNGEDKAGDNREVKV